MPLLNSAILALGSAAIALPMGGLLAVLIARFDVPGRRMAAACLGLMLFLPLYVQLAGWDAALGKLGWYSLTYGSMAQPFLAGLRGAIFVHGVAAIPWAALLIGVGLLQVDPAQEEAALLVFPPGQVLWRITLRQTLPFFAAAAVWTVVSTTSEMTVTNIYLTNPRDWTSTERLYMSFAAADAANATLAAIPSMVALVITIVLALGITARLSRQRRASAARPITFSTGRWRPVFAGLLWLGIVLLLGVPIVSLISKAGFVVIHDGSRRFASWSAAACFHEMALAPRRFAAEFRGTGLVASLAASLAAIIGSLLAWRARARRQSMPARLAIVLGLAIPGPLVGVALIQLFNHDLPPRIDWGSEISKSWLLLLYDDTPLAPVLAQAIRALPLATLILWHSFASLDEDVLSAAALDGLAPRRVFWKIAFPQRWQAIAAAWIAAFAVAAGDLAWAHLVTPPGLDLLQRRVFGLVHSGVEEQVAAIALVNVVAYALLTTAAAALLLLKRQPGRFPVKSTT